MSKVMISGLGLMKRDWVKLENVLWSWNLFELISTKICPMDNVSKHDETDINYRT